MRIVTWRSSRSNRSNSDHDHRKAGPSRHDTRPAFATFRPEITFSRPKCGHFFSFVLAAVTPTVSPGVRFGRMKHRQGAV